jgi:hypothetical protein
MRNLRLLLPSLALTALTASGCFLVSGQFMVKLELDDLTVASPNSIRGLALDLSTNSTYKDHKDKIKDLADFALLGKVHNNSSSELQLEVYMIANGTSATLTRDQVLSSGIRVWGPMIVPGNGDVAIGWDESAALFTPEGKEALFSEIKGDGQFALYAVGAAANFDFTSGVVVAVLAAGA